MFSTDIGEYIMSIHTTYNEWKNDPANAENAPIQWVFFQMGEVHTYYSSDETVDMNMMQYHIRNYVFINGWQCSINSPNN